MKTAYIDKLGNVIVPFDSLDIGEVVKVICTDTGDYDTILVTKDNGCSGCPYLSESHYVCTTKWVHGHMEVPLCITRCDDDGLLSFKLMDNILEDI